MKKETQTFNIDAQIKVSKQIGSEASKNKIIIKRVSNISII